MSDIATIWDPAQSRGDWAVPVPTPSFVVGPDGKPVLDASGRAIPTRREGALMGAGLVSGQDLETAVLISLFTDAAAGADDVIPDGSDDRRGWWGDASLGSRIWLRQRAKQTAETLLLVKADIKAALDWLIDDGVAAAIDIDAEWIRAGLLGCQITVRRRDGTTQTVAFSWAWKDI